MRLYHGFATLSQLAAASILKRFDTILTQRPETATVSLVKGDYTPYQSGYLAGKWELFSNGQYITLNGTGYLRCRWELEYWKGTGAITDISFTDKSGTFLSVAGGGGYAQSDQPPSCYDSSDSCKNYTGSTNYGYSWFTDMADPYHNEYYYLDGEITITNHESPGLYNVGVAPVCTFLVTCPIVSGTDLWNSVRRDINRY
jgi:hypothetical protein